LGPPLLTQSPRRRTQNWSGESEAEAGSTEQSAGEAGGEMMDSRRWQSPAAAAAAAEAAEEDTGGAGGPSRRPARRGVHRASPYGYGGGPRRWLPSPPVASRIFPSMLRDGAPAGDSPSLPSLSRASLPTAVAPFSDEDFKMGEICDVLPILLPSLSPLAE